MCKVTAKCWRSTFIDDKSPHDEAVLRRSQSCPHFDVVHEDHFHQERDYVASLESRAQQLFQTARWSPRCCSRQDSCAPSEVSTADHGLAERLLPLELKECDSDSDNGDTRTSPLLSMSAPPSVSDADWVACNPGTRGHPQLCARPCVSFFKGFCAAGRSCGHCHMTHPHRMSHLDRRNRDLLKVLSFYERVQLFQPLVEGRLDELAATGPEVAAAASELRQLFHQCCEAPPSQPSQGSACACTGARFNRSKLMNLRKAVEATSSLRSLLALLLDSKATPSGSRRSVAIERAMEQLRTAIEVQQVKHEEVSALPMLMA